MGVSKPVISVVGLSKSGKTTFLESLVAELVRRGIRVGVVKHTPHEFQVDKEGKDSFRLRKAGAKTVVLSSPHQIAVISDLKEELPLAQIVERFMAHVDIVITEGYKREQTKKIEVVDPKKVRASILKQRDGLMCVISDSPVETDAPVYKSSDVERIADLLIEEFIRRPVS